MGIFSGVGTASGKGGKGDYFPEGFEGDIEIEKVEVVNVRQKGSAIAVKFKILTSVGTTTVPPGATKDWFQGLWNTDVAWPELLRWLYATLGKTTDEGEEKVKPLAEGLLEKASSAEQALTGKRLHAKFVSKETKTLITVPATATTPETKVPKRITVPIFSIYQAPATAAA